MMPPTLKPAPLPTTTTKPRQNSPLNTGSQQAAAPPTTMPPSVTHTTDQPPTATATAAPDTVPSHANPTRRSTTAAATTTRRTRPTPHRKRRRSPPPLTVTSAFTSANLPTSCRAFWQWPVTSWYLGDPTASDSNFVSDNPFKTPPHVPPTLPSAHATAQIPTHYRLQWLSHDAAQHIDCIQPPLPHRIAPLPSMQTTCVPSLTGTAKGEPTPPPACARPSPALNPDDDENEVPTKRKTRCSNSNTDSPANRQRGRGRIGRRRTTSHSLSTRPRKRRRATEPAADTILTESVRSGDVAEDDMLNMAKPPLFSPVGCGLDCTPPTLPPLLSDERLASLCATGHPAFSSANSTDTYLKSVVMPLVGENATMQGEMPMVKRPLEDDEVNDDGALPHLPSFPAVPSNAGAKPESTTVSLFGDGDAVLKTTVEKNESEVGCIRPLRKRVRLQMMGKAEDIVMATLTYSLTGMDGASIKGKDGIEVLTENNEADVVGGAVVDGVDLQFRRKGNDSSGGFDDEDDADELAGEIGRLVGKREIVRQKSNKVRLKAREVLSELLKERAEMEEMLEEEKKVVGRLAEITRAKQAAVRAEAARKREALLAARRKSTRLRNVSGRKRCDNTPVEVGDDGEVQVEELGNCDRASGVGIVGETSTFGWNK